MIEVIEMGQIDPDGPVGGWIAAGDCDALSNAWASGGAWTSDAATGFMASWNGGGLIGTATLVNVAGGTGVGYDAAAVEDMVSSGPSGSALHYGPGPMVLPLAMQRLVVTWHLYSRQLTWLMTIRLIRIFLD